MTEQEPPALKLTERGVVFERLIEETDETLKFEASYIQQSMGRPHAVVTLVLGSRLLAYSYISLTRDEDRTRLANSAWVMLEDAPIRESAYPKKFLKHDLDIFCRDVWPEWVAAQEGQLVEGGGELRVRMILKPFVIEGGGTILYAPPGAGKSWTLMAMMVAIDAGLQKPWETTQQPVLFVNIERSADSVRRRLAQVNKALGLSSNRPLRILNARGKSLRDIEESIVKTIHDHGIKVLGLDSMSRAGYGDLGADKVANAIVDTLNNLIGTWAAIGHSPRADATHVFGSIHFDAGADMMVRLASEQRGSTLGLSLLLTKANDRPTGARELLALEFDSDGLTGIRKSGETEFAALAVEAGRPMPVLEQLLRTIDMLGGEANATVLADSTGHQRSYISDILHTSGVVKSRREGREILFSRVDRPSWLEPGAEEEMPF